MNRTEDHLSKIGDQLAKNLGGDGVRQAIGQPAKTVPAPVPARGFWALATDSIVPDIHQVRQEFDADSLEFLASDLKRRGLLQPIRVRKTQQDNYQIVSGERRWRAAKMAAIKEVPCFIIDHDMTESGLLEEQLAENLHRAELSEVEKAQGFFQLITKNSWTQASLAQALNLSDASVSRALKLLELPDVIRQYVADGKLSASTAYEIGRLADPEKQKLFAEQAVAGGLSREAVTAAVSGETSRRSHKTSRTGHRLACRLPIGTNVTLSSVNGEPLTVEHVIEVFSLLLSKAKKLRTKNLPIDELPSLLKAAAREKAEESPAAESSLA